MKEDQKTVQVIIHVKFPGDMEWPEIVRELDEAECAFGAASSTEVHIADYHLIEHPNKGTGIYGTL